jgi:hypothetical protein
MGALPTVNSCTHFAPKTRQINAEGTQIDGGVSNVLTLLMPCLGGMPARIRLPERVKTL